MPIEDSRVAKLVLYEEDGPFRMNLANYLRRNGLQVTEADNALEALDAAGDAQVVLIGLKEDGAEGLALLERIKERRPRAAVILLVPSGQAALSIEGMKRGAFDDLMIPFDLSLLLRKVIEAGAVAHEDRMGTTTQGGEPDSAEGPGKPRQKKKKARRRTETRRDR
ncbi:response regulator [Desulfoglaeba alkanexedens]|uniref:Response regulator n=1 Tax=Desulfoglaeba alkanexedens ALDC TaxID=980445 RepID=A0A4P8L193_9BACT|nr:response regulator [Desulfoglaeba alkanexedens]QCQ21530.1 response regulator [Desulfoglaeba alkanexedens ALDC]